MKKHVLTITLSLMLSSVSFAAVWTAQGTWSEATEKQYRDWVTLNWTADFFSKPGPFKDLKLDCADAAYSMRVVYAYVAKLPLAFNDPTGGTKAISQEMTRWDSLPEEQRVRKFLLFVFETFSTVSLPEDTYPAALNPQSLSSGSIILTDRKNHHAWTIQSFNEYGIPFLIYGSRPATTVLFTRFEYPTVGFVFPVGISPETKAGFRNWKRPVDLKTPSLHIAGASDEQYRLPASLWEKSIQKKMALINEDLNTKAKRVLAGACQSMKDRREVVFKGDELNRSLGSQCMNATQYDDFSTPSRDSRFLDQVKTLQLISAEAKLNPNSLDEATAQKMQSLREGELTRDDPNAFCRIEIKPGLEITLAQMAERLLTKKTSDNPMESIERRWGFTSQSSEKANRCPKY